LGTKRKRERDREVLDTWDHQGSQQQLQRRCNACVSKYCRPINWTHSVSFTIPEATLGHGIGLKKKSIHPDSIHPDSIGSRAAQHKLEVSGLHKRRHLRGKYIHRKLEITKHAVWEVSDDRFR
jgi:hypothetical protein